MARAPKRTPTTVLDNMYSSAPMQDEVTQLVTETRAIASIVASLNDKMDIIHNQLSKLITNPPDNGRGGTGGAIKTKESNCKAKSSAAPVKNTQHTLACNNWLKEQVKDEKSLMWLCIIGKKTDKSVWPSPLPILNVDKIEQELLKAKDGKYARFKTADAKRKFLVETYVWKASKDYQAAIRKLRNSSHKNETACVEEDVLIDSDSEPSAVPPIDDDDTD